MNGSIHSFVLRIWLKRTEKLMSCVTNISTYGISIINTQHSIQSLQSSAYNLYWLEIGFVLIILCRKLLTQPPLIENTRPTKRAKLTNSARDEVLKPDGVLESGPEQNTTSTNNMHPTASSAAVEKRRRVKVPKEKKSEEPTVPCSAVLSGRQCKSRAQHGAQYCWRHLPLDPNSEWVWCAHTDSGGKQCSNPVLKNKVIALFGKCHH